MYFTVKPNDKDVQFYFFLGIQQSKIYEFPKRVANSAGFEGVNINLFSKFAIGAEIRCAPRYGGWSVRDERM